MSLSLVITINALADIALLGGLAYVMSHARKLEPHVASVQMVQSTPSEQLAPQRQQRQQRHVARPGFARPGTSVAARSGAQPAGARESA
jgi:hypothetical protein